MIEIFHTTIEVIMWLGAAWLAVFIFIWLMAFMRGPSGISDE